MVTVKDIGGCCGGGPAAAREDRVGHFNILHNLSFTRRRAVIKPHEHGAWLPRSRWSALVSLVGWQKKEDGRAARFTILCGSAPDFDALSSITVT